MKSWVTVTDTLFKIWSCVYNSPIFKLSNHLQPVAINKKRAGSHDELVAILLSSNSHTRQKQPASNHHHSQDHRQIKSPTNQQPKSPVSMKWPTLHLKKTTKCLFALGIVQTPSGNVYNYTYPEERPGSVECWLLRPRQRGFAQIQQRPVSPLRFQRRAGIP